jgi:transcription factor C subunit 6
MTVSDWNIEEVQDPLATLKIRGEHGVEITCFTWVNANRIAAGLSDGSVAVWSIHPCRLLQRHPIHPSPIMDITSSYPSHPFIIATTPVGGLCTVTDLSRPNQELVYCANPNTSFQPNLLAWSEHLRGYVSTWPTSFPGNSTVSFLAARVYPQARMLINISGQPTCLAMGSCHPYILVGSSDGSVWITNTMRKSIFHRMRTNKLKLFQHEYNALVSSDEVGAEDEETPRGVCRILHGFRPEDNGHPRAAKAGEQLRKANEAKGGPARKKRRGTGQGEEAAQKTNAAPDEDSEGMRYASSSLVVQDPLSRITFVTWNPNVEFSWWAAAAMGSGLVRIMDLGVDQRAVGSSRPGPKTKDGEENEGVDVDEDELGEAAYGEASEEEAEVTDEYGEDATME